MPIPVTGCIYVSSSPHKGMQVLFNWRVAWTFPHAHGLFMLFPLLMGLESVPSGESQSVAGGDEDALDDYQELSTREEQDIESMMEMCEYAISNAEAFAEQLSKELQVLDGVSDATFELKPEKYSYSPCDFSVTNFSKHGHLLISSLRPTSSPSWHRRSRSTS